MDPQTIDFNHGRQLVDPPEKNALWLLNSLQLRAWLEAQPLAERLGYDNPTRFIDPQFHAIDNTRHHTKWQERELEAFPGSQSVGTAGSPAVGQDDVFALPHNLESSLFERLHSPKM